MRRCGGRKKETSTDNTKLTRLEPVIIIEPSLLVPSDLSAHRA